MITTRFQTTTRRFIATMALAVVGLTLAAAPPVDAAGLRNCVDISGSQSGRVGCYENVWADDVEYRMTFANQGFDGATPKELDPFYVVAPQTDAAQGPVPTFPHDHVVRDVPAHNRGSYSVQLQGFFVLCTGQGLVSGACVPFWMAPPGASDPLPFATTVDGEPLTSAGAIESAAHAGLVALINLGPSAVIVGTISGS
jgi:hypothetical protein